MKHKTSTLLSNVTFDQKALVELLYFISTMEVGDEYNSQYCNLVKVEDGKFEMRNTNKHIDNLVEELTQYNLASNY